MKFARNEMSPEMRRWDKNVSRSVAGTSRENHVITNRHAIVTPPVMVQADGCRWGVWLGCFMFLLLISTNRHDTSQQHDEMAAKVFRNNTRLPMCCYSNCCCC